MKSLKPATEILLAAAFVLTPEENWTTGTYARDVKGNRVSPIIDAACQFCAAGAIEQSAHAMGLACFMGAAFYAFETATTDSVMAAHQFNDAHTHAEVLAALYRAAELSEQS